jgi:hypothetical protein
MVLIEAPVTIDFVFMSFWGSLAGCSPETKRLHEHAVEVGSTRSAPHAGSGVTHAARRRKR